MYTRQNFKNNLILLQELKGLSLSEYAAELDLPKSTLQSILTDGNTSLHTAIHISDQLHTSLDSLLDDQFPAEKHELLLSCLHFLTWFASLTAEKQRTVLLLMEELLK